MNLMTAANDLKGLSDQQLQSQLLQPSGQVPSFLVLSELQRRSEVRQDYSSRAQGGDPQPSMAEQYAQGLGGQADSPYANAVKQGEGAPGSTPAQPPQGMSGPMDQAMPQPPNPMGQPMPQQPQGFADGGGVGQLGPLAGLFDRGGRINNVQMSGGGGDSSAAARAAMMGLFSNGGQQGFAAGGPVADPGYLTRLFQGQPYQPGTPYGAGMTTPMGGAMVNGLTGTNPMATPAPAAPAPPAMAQGLAAAQQLVQNAATTAQMGWGGAASGDAGAGQGGNAADGTGGATGPGDSGTGAGPGSSGSAGDASADGGGTYRWGGGVRGFAEGGYVDRMKGLSTMPLSTDVPWDPPMMAPPGLYRPDARRVVPIGVGDPNYQNPYTQGLPGMTGPGPSAVPPGGEPMFNPRGSIYQRGSGTEPSPTASDYAAGPPRAGETGGTPDVAGGIGGVALNSPPAGGQGYAGPDPVGLRAAAGPAISPAARAAVMAPPGEGDPAAAAGGGAGGAGGGGPGGGGGAGGASGRGQTLADYYKSIQDIKLPDRYGELSAQNAKDKQDLTQQVEGEKGMTLLQMGFAIAAGDSPNPIINIGRGGMVGVKYWQDAQKEMRQAQRDLRNADQAIAIAQANRDERGLENAIKIKAHSEDLDSRAKDRASAAGIAAATRAQALELKKLELDDSARNRLEAQEQHRLNGFQTTARTLGQEANVLQTKLLGLKPTGLESPEEKQRLDQEVAQTRTLLQQRLTETNEANTMLRRSTLQRELRLGNVVMADPQKEGFTIDGKKMQKGQRFMTHDYRTGTYGGGDE